MWFTGFYLNEKNYKFTLQSEWPQTITCLMSLSTHPSSRAAGSHVVYSSRKCCECGIKLPAFLTKQQRIIKN